MVQTVTDSELEQFLVSSSWIAMEDVFDYDPFSVYKYLLQQQQEEEPTSVLELVYNSPSPSTSLQFSPSDIHPDDALHDLLHKRSECVPIQYISNEHVPNLCLTELDSLLNMDLPQDMDLDAILPSIYESVTGETSVLHARPSSSSLEGLNLGPNNFAYGNGSDVVNCLLSRFGGEELPPLNNYDWSDVLDMGNQNQQPCEMVVQSFLDPPVVRQIEQLTNDSENNYAQLLQMEGKEAFGGFSTPRVEGSPSSHTKVPSLEYEFNSSGSLSFSLETSESSVTTSFKRNTNLLGLTGIADECPRMFFLDRNVVTSEATSNEDESAMVATLNRKMSSRDLAINEDVTTEFKPYDKMQLLEKLVSCAQAVACHDNRQGEMTLRQIDSMISPYGDSLQRVASCFAEGLRARLAVPTSACLQQEGLERVVYEGCPFIPFGHFATNSMILESIEGEEIIHIVDLGVGLGLQWPALIQSLGYRASGRPRLLRITGVGASLEKLNAARQDLEKSANWVKLPFEFRAIIVQNGLESLNKGMLDLKAGEAVVINSVLQFHALLKESRRGLNSLLKLVHDIAPKILTVVEQEGNHNGPFFLGRFNEALQYYTTIFESLEATMSRCSSKRAKIEQCYFGEQIKNIVSCEGPARVERHERLDQWRRRMGRAGFQPFCFNLLTLKARIWLARYDYCDDFSLTEEKGSLVLGWKGRPVIAASAWRCS